MASNESFTETASELTPVVLTMTALYVLIFLTGVIGNVSTCIVIARNRHMHTTTNYYLFSLAISDLLLLICGLPQEIYFTLWEKPYTFGQSVCFLTGLISEACANATVLTITAFTVERYVAICYPFLSHTVCKLSRAVKFIIVIWIVALILAVPQAIQFEVLVERTQDVPPGNDTFLWTRAKCTINRNRTEWQDHTFELSTCLFFILPMSLITCLYILIALKLRNSRRIKRPSVSVEPLRSQNHVIRMLVAVVVAFFICWAPFHAQRLLAIYASSRPDAQNIILVYTTLTYVSGLLYFVSTTVNPVLYNIMSLKFRDAFKSTLYQLLGRGRRTSSQSRTYSVLSRVQPPHPVTSGTGPTKATMTPAAMAGASLRVEPPPPVARRPATISNSSLRDVETEFTESELAEYVEQLNSS